jgi:hypothetical protein
MKIGSIPVASVVLIAYGLMSFITKHYYPSNYAHLAPYFDGALIGGMCVVLFYYVNIYVSAWLNNRREESFNSEN